MKLNIHTAIIGAGFAGMMVQHRLNALGHTENIIFERGFTHGKSSDNYIVYTKGEYPFSGRKIQTKSNKFSSGAKSFKQEYTEKLYLRSLDVDLYADDDMDEIEFEGHAIDVPKLFTGSRIYGNIEIVEVNLDTRTLYGKVLHLNKNVEIKYEYLINTMPIYEFFKLAGYNNMLSSFRIFISYYPIGIKKAVAEVPCSQMISDYYSDPNIPFYRKHQYGNLISYEYCLNKPFKDRFDAVVIPGKFITPERDKLHVVYDYLRKDHVYLAGRYALWDADFILDFIVEQSREHLLEDYMKAMYQEIAK